MRQLTVTIVTDLKDRGKQILLNCIYVAFTYMNETVCSVYIKRFSTFFWKFLLEFRSMEQIKLNSIYYFRPNDITEFMCFVYRLIFLDFKLISPLT